MDYSKDTTKCPWKLGDPIEKSPHIHEPFRPIPKKIYDNAVDAIGNTPMIRMNKVGIDEGIQCQLLAKCEFMNMGGSVKDRIGKRMVEDAEKKGLLKPGDRIVEATSGNTGIGIALACAVKGYQCLITLPQKMSTQKADVLKGLGAKVYRTPTEAAFDAPESHIGVSLKLRDEGAILLDQYCNPSNPIGQSELRVDGCSSQYLSQLNVRTLTCISLPKPQNFTKFMHYKFILFLQLSYSYILAHYDQLAQQILYQTDGFVDAVVVGVGTGGTIAGISRKIKEKSPNTIIVGSDPIGSILALPGELNVPGGTYKVEGVGYDFVPRTCQRDCVDHWVKTEDVGSLTLARKLIRKQGLLVGGSSGGTLYSAFQFIKQKGWQNDKTKRVVCVFQDSVRNYITKFLSKEWCVQNKILPYEELNQEGNIFTGKTLESLNLPSIQPVADLTIAQAKALFAKGQRIIPIIAGQIIQSVITPRKFIELVNLKKLKPEDSVLKTKTKDFVIVPHTLDVAQLSKILERHEAILVEERSNDKSKLEKLYLATTVDIIKIYQ